MALHKRKPTHFIHHSDRGSQYAYQDLLKAHGVQISMSRRGDAVVESFFATLKQEALLHTTYPTRQSAKTALFETNFFRVLG